MVNLLDYGFKQKDILFIRKKGIQNLIIMFKNKQAINLIFNSEEIRDNQYELLLKKESIIDKLERVFNIVKIKLENSKLKKDLYKEQTEHEKTENCLDFYRTNYENQVEKNIKMSKVIKHEKELHDITKKDLQQAQLMLRGEYKCQEK